MKDLSKTVLGDKLNLVFGKDENIMLICKPNIRAFLSSKTESILAVLLFFTIPIAISYIYAVYKKKSMDVESFYVIFAFVLVFWGYGYIKDILKAKNTTYIFTNLSVITHIQTQQTSTTIFNLKEIVSYTINRDFLDKYFNTGTIKIFTGNTELDDGKIQKVFDNINSIEEFEKAMSIIAKSKDF